mgnify:CR=1 FL=1
MIPLAFVYLDNWTICCRMKMKMRLRCCLL